MDWTSQLTNLNSDLHKGIAGALFVLVLIISIVFFVWFIKDKELDKREKKEDKR